MPFGRGTGEVAQFVEPFGRGTGEVAQSVEPFGLGTGEVAQSVCRPSVVCAMHRRYKINQKTVSGGLESYFVSLNNFLTRSFSLMQRLIKKVRVQSHHVRVTKTPDLRYHTAFSGGTVGEGTSCIPYNL